MGGAAWVALVGSAITAVRLYPLRVAPGPTVAAMPVEHRFFVGIRFLAVPLLAATIAYVVLYMLRPTVNDAAADRASHRLRHNACGLTPRGLGWILFVMAVVGVVLVLAFAEVGVGHRVLLACIFVLGAVVTFMLVGRVVGWAQASLLFFAGVAITTGVMAVAYEALRDTRLDTAAVLRENGTAVTGFYVTKSSDAVYLLTATVVGRGVGEPDTRASGDPPPLSDDDVRCEDNEELGHLLGEDKRCFVNELVGIPFDDVKRLVIGPRSVIVDARGYRAAQPLARFAGLPGDAPTPEQ